MSCAQLPENISCGSGTCGDFYFVILAAEHFHTKRATTFWAKTVRLKAERTPRRDKLVVIKGKAAGRKQLPLKIRKTATKGAVAGRSCTQRLVCMAVMNQSFVLCHDCPFHCSWTAQQTHEGCPQLVSRSCRFSQMMWSFWLQKLMTCSCWGHLQRRISLWLCSPLGVSGLVWDPVTSLCFGVWALVIRVTLIGVGVSSWHEPPHCLLLYLPPSQSLLNCLVFRFNYGGFCPLWR